MNWMASLAQEVNRLEAWHWLALGAILLAIEIVSTTMYLLWPGIAALLVGALNFLSPSIGGPLSVFLFAVLAMVSSVAWHRSPYGRRASAKPNHVNARMQTYLGRRGAAAGDFIGGHGAILLDDTRWAAVADGADPKGGEMLQVTGADGTVLRVRVAA
jgi:membrane protein implicated in regulation of membrane protease activity